MNNRISLILAIVFCILLGTFQVEAQTKRITKRAEKKAQIEKEFWAYSQLLQTKTFKFEAVMAHSAEFPSVDINPTQNTVEMINGVANASLSFFGRSTSSNTRGNAGSIEFYGVVENYKVEINERKKTIKTSFQIRDKQDFFTCSLNVDSKGYTYFNVASQFKSYISYSGQIFRLKID